MLQFKLANLCSLLIFVAGILACLPQFSFLKTFWLIVMVSLASSVLNYGRMKPVFVSALTGAAFVATLILIAYLYMWTEYLFFYTGARPYFMDGAIEEGVIYPCTFLVLFMPLGAMIGAISVCPLLIAKWTSKSRQPH